MICDSALILAAGKATRFGGGTPKPLLQFNGNTLLQRQTRQCSAFGIIPTVVTDSNKVLAAHNKCLTPEHSTTILHTLKSSRQAFGKRTAILLGDVFYSDSLICSMLSSNAPLMFWVSGSEVYGLTFTEESDVELLTGIEAAIGATNDCKLWHLYRVLHHSDPHTHLVFGSDITSPLIVDETFDVDSEQQYRDKLKLWPNPPYLAS